MVLDGVAMLPRDDSTKSSRNNTISLTIQVPRLYDRDAESACKILPAFGV